MNRKILTFLSLCVMAATAIRVINLVSGLLLLNRVNGTPSAKVSLRGIRALSKLTVLVMKRPYGAAATKTAMMNNLEKRNRLLDNYAIGEGELLGMLDGLSRGRMRGKSEAINRLVVEIERSISRYVRDTYWMGEQTPVGVFRNRILPIISNEEYHAGVRHLLLKDADDMLTSDSSRMARDDEELLRMLLDSFSKEKNGKAKGQTLAIIVRHWPNENSNELLLPNLDSPHAEVREVAAAYLPYGKQDAASLARVKRMFDKYHKSDRLTARRLLRFYGIVGRKNHQLRAQVLQILHDLRRNETNPELRSLIKGRIESVQNTRQDEN